MLSSFFRDLDFVAFFNSTYFSRVAAAAFMLKANDIC